MISYSEGQFTMISLALFLKCSDIKFQLNSVNIYRTLICQSSTHAGDIKIQKHGGRDPPNLESNGANCPRVDKYGLK